MGIYCSDCEIDTSQKPPLARLPIPNKSSAYYSDDYEHSQIISQRHITLAYTQ